MTTACPHCGCLGHAVYGPLPPEWGPPQWAVMNVPKKVYENLTQEQKDAISKMLQEWITPK